MSLDVAALRAHFPALAEGAAHFDGPGGSQVPDVVATAVAETMTSAIANRGTVTRAERRAEQVVQDARAAMGDLLGTAPGGVVFGRSMTALTYDMARTLSRTWSAGDEVVVTRLDHDANIRPWVQAAERVGAVVRWADFDPATGELPPEAVGDLLSDRTRLVAVTAASNLIGTRPDVAAIADLVHGTPGLLYVDGVHYTPHVGVDVKAMGADFFACSPYKFMGPHCGVVAASPELLETLQPEKLLPSSNAVPERFELGTLPYELLAGTTAAVDFIASLSPLGGAGDRRTRVLSAMQSLEEHEDRLRERIEKGISALPGAVLYSQADRRTPTLLVRFEGHDSQDVRAALAERNVNAPAACFYAIEASRVLGLGDTGALRIGLAPYNDEDDADRLVQGLAEVVGG
ncbi:cysteine desulfurase family protein, VC1184 subfamily [Pedococcus cremeus]|uniref:Cysteine desulfurase family protein, VC1184 subfamily n=1 Tax=Pedococcus cremeus TaxID=587636 RepID=A0A1H9VPC4_9MICO|nr:cysteine desulfurase-like protein [Pedococcus cremeus]SES23586.1 cysteine desulfurase family protein, VC1184 subfamily [Pedococcus cremeus]